MTSSDVACSLDLSGLILLKVLCEPAAKGCTVMHADRHLFLMVMDPSKPTFRPPPAVASRAGVKTLSLAQSAWQMLPIMLTKDDPAEAGSRTLGVMRPCCLCLHQQAHPSKAESMASSAGSGLTAGCTGSFASALSSARAWSAAWSSWLCSGLGAGGIAPWPRGAAGWLLAWGMLLVVCMGDGVLCISMEP